MPSVIIKRTETQVSRLCVFSLLQPHRTEVRLTGKYRYKALDDTQVAKFSGHLTVSHKVESEVV